MNTQHILKQLRRRMSLVRKLAKERKALAAHMAKIDRHLASLVGPSSDNGAKSAPRKRAKNKLSLADAMAKVLSKDKPMAVADVEKAVRRIGYKSTSKTFRTIIYQSLGKDKRFKKVGRGKYSLKG